MKVSSAPGLVLARTPHARGAAPCILFDAMRDGAGRVRDFRWTTLNPAAEALVRELEAGPGAAGWEEGVRALLDVAAGVRVVETGQPHTGEVRCRLRRGEARFHTTVVRQGEGLALWLEEAADAREEARWLREELARERAARVRAEEALGVDCAEHEQALRALREAEERYRLAAWATHDVLWEWSFEAGRVMWSEACLPLFGYLPEQMGHSFEWWCEQVHPEDRDAVVDGVRRFIATGGEEGWRAEYRFRRRDGSWAHVLDRGVVARDEAGRPVRMVGSMMDMTERKRAVEQLAEEARFRERFIGILGHDLRNPLNAISLSARAMKRRGGLTPAQQEFVQRIESSAARMGTMISDILDLTRARLSGGIPLALAPTRLSAVCRQVVEELSAGHPERDIAYEEEDGGEGCWDAERLAQVVSNLVGNALEHGPVEAPVLLRSWREGDWQVLEVNNAGPPIPPSQLATLFGPFGQGGVPGRGKRNGLGLGLFIVKEIVQAHGGRVTVRSSAEEGTTFTVLLPYEARGAGAPVAGPRVEARSA